MANNKKDFSDKDFNCKKCRAHLATEKLDRQILVVGESLAIFNFASIVCLSCEKINLWQSPNLLRDKNEKSLCRSFDKATDLPKPNKELVARLGVNGVSRGDNGKFRARITVDGKTKYLGYFDSIGAASAAYQTAKLSVESQKQFADNLKQNNSQNEINQHRAATKF
jgi:hypothetical protein